MHLFLFPIAHYARLNSCPLLAPDHGPALELRNRAVFFQPHDVSDRELVRLIVCVILLRPPHGLLQDRVGEAALDADNDGLVLLIAHHGALQHPLRHSVISYFFSDARFCAAMVLMRAMSRRTMRTRPVFSSWPVARWKRKLNCSFLSFKSSSESWSGLIARASSAFIVLYSAMRCTKRVLIGSLAAASASASLASCTGTPSSSNRMRPGLIRTTQYSTAPLPEPMRTSSGFFVTGTSGNTRIHTRPARFI